MSCQTFGFLKGGKKTITQLELQEEVQRFYTRFTEKIAESFLKLDKRISPDKSLVIKRQYLLYDSEALKIATGPYPELNLLDMLIFIKLNGMVVKKYWVPEVFSEDGKSIATAFEEAEIDINQLALKLLTKEQLHTLHQYLRDWMLENPGFRRVEKIRLGDFEEFAADIKASKKKSSRISITNLIVDVKSPVEAVDQAVLVSNRAIFLAQQMPFLIRLHARIGSVEVAEDLFAMDSDVDPLLNNLNSLFMQMTLLSREMNQLLSEYRKTFPVQAGTRGGIQAQEEGFFSQINSILDPSHEILRMLTEKEIRPGRLKKIETKLWNVVMTFMGLIIIISFFISFFWWGGYYLAQKRLRR